MEKRLVSFRLPDDLMHELKEKAQADGVSVTELVCRFSRQGLQSNSSNYSTTLELDAKAVDPKLNDRVLTLEAKLDILLELLGGGVWGRLQTKP